MRLHISLFLALEVGNLDSRGFRKAKTSDEFGVVIGWPAESDEKHDVFSDQMNEGGLSRYLPSSVKHKSEAT